jgi:hypothetical protein
MSFVNRSGNEEQNQDLEAAGAPPVDWDLDDPDLVKVHYDVSGWTFDQRAELSEAFAEAGHPHTWHGDELVVPESIEVAADAVFADLERRLGPFAVPLGLDEPSTEFGLDEWPASDLEILRSALVESEIPHRWEGTTKVFVATEAEDDVDDLLDAIERGDVASFDDDDGGAPDGALGRLFSIGDRLAREPANGSARFELFELYRQLDGRRPPFGMARGSWSRIVESAGALVADFEADEHDPSEVIGHAQDLRTITRPFV